jgi:hypothetical protein
VSLKGTGFSLKGTGFSLKGTGFSLKGTGFSLKGTGFSLKGTSFSLKGTGFSLKGTGFSPYINAAKSSWALAPEGSSFKPTHYRFLSAHLLRRFAASPRLSKWAPEQCSMNGGS